MYTRLHADENGIVGKGVKFERIRRVTGYLVGTLDRFNDVMPKRPRYMTE